MGCTICLTPALIKAFHTLNVKAEKLVYSQEDEGGANTLVPPEFHLKISEMNGVEKTQAIKGKFHYLWKLY